MKIGYARISTDEQTLSLQLDALQAADCENIFSDEGISGATRNRPGLSSALSAVNKGDILVVWKLDRLGRSLPHLLELITGLGEEGIGFQSLSEQIDTSSAGGRLVFHIMGALAEFERSLISERTKAGMKAARRRGIHVGRPQMLSG
jgi:DNA invertase Pin-like site-specific DNA recombinase